MDKCKINMIDATCSQGYTVPYEMYDDNKGWIFNPEQALKELSTSLPLKINL